MNEEIHKDEIIKNAIIKAAQDLFKQYGISKTTMEDIAQKTGKAKSTLYYYYKNKEEIFYAVANKETDEVTAFINEKINSQNTAADKIVAYMTNSVAIFNQKINLYGIVKGEIKEHWGIINQIKQKLNSSEINKIADILRFGISNGEFRYLDDRDVEIFAYVLVIALRAITENLIYDNPYPDLESRIHMLLDVLLNGVKA
ncbi:MAG: TetR/AcrR family transcriptional regulator [bacterium]